MSRLSSLTQQLANFFPEWARVRFDEQSLGFGVLNSLALPLERANKELVRSSKFHLSLLNLDEIDWVYRTELGPSFEFATDETDSYNVTFVPPTVSGLLDGTYYEVALADSNDLETFWYKHIPDRISVEAVTSGSHLLLDRQDVSLAPFSGVMTCHEPGHLFVSLAGAGAGTSYIQENDNGSLERAKVVLRGRTRKGTFEEEMLVFPWDQTQKTTKEWRYLDRVSVYGVPSGVSISIKSGDFNNGPYLDFWNFMYSPHRNKIDQFWDVTSETRGSVLEVMHYSSDELKALLAHVFELYPDRRFELLDMAGNNVDIVDIAIQPFSDFIWAVSDSKLFCYDNYMLLASADDLRERTPDARGEIELSDNHIIRDQEIEIEFISKDTFGDVQAKKLTIDSPDGTTSGIVNGSLVATPTWVYGGALSNGTMEARLEFAPSQLGNYVITMEMRLADSSTQQDIRVLSVDSKTPLAEFDLPVSGVLGIAFDSDQNIELLVPSGYLKVNAHHDVMMIDYDRKVILTREPYEEISLWT
jgi:hypothetical protein